MRRKLVWDCILIYLAAQLLLLFSIRAPSEMYFDEIHYVKAAKQIWDLVPNKNIEHPPLGKAIIGLGILLFGDGPLGWRAMSTFFGALTLVGVFLLAYKLFESRKWAYVSVLLTLLNNVFFIESRLAVIDPFMTAFLIFALFGICGALRATRQNGWLILAGLCFGLSMACKWSAVPVYLFCVCLLLHQLRGRGPWPLILGMIVVPAAAYFLAFMPYYFVDAPGYHVTDFIQMQTNIWTAQMLTPGQTPYQSVWYEWPLMLKPYWYVFTPDVAAGYVRGILFVGNPVVIYSGLLAMIYLLFQKNRLFLILPIVFAILWLLPWSILEREASFFYYYYPAMMLFGPAIAFFLKNFESRKWILPAFLAVAVFISALLFPLAAYLAISKSTFQAASAILPPVYIWRLD